VCPNAVVLKSALTLSKHNSMGGRPTSDKQTGRPDCRRSSAASSAAHCLITHCVARDVSVAFTFSMWSLLTADARSTIFNTPRQIEPPAATILSLAYFMHGIPRSSRLVQEVAYDYSNYGEGRPYYSQDLKIVVFRTDTAFYRTVPSQLFKRPRNC